MPTVAMCAPHEFRVGSRINPWMQSASPVDPALASTQWRRLADTYAALGVDVVTVVPETALSGFDLHTVDVGEFIKAGGGVRCLSLVQDAPAARAAATAWAAPPVHGSP